MFDTYFHKSFAGSTSTLVSESWWTRLVVWTDLAVHRHPRERLAVYVLLAWPGAIATWLGIGLTAAGYSLGATFAGAGAMLADFQSSLACI